VQSDWKTTKCYNSSVKSVMGERSPQREERCRKREVGCFASHLVEESGFSDGIHAEG